MKYLLFVITLYSNIKLNITYNCPPHHFLPKNKKIIFLNWFAPSLQLFSLENLKNYFTSWCGHLTLWWFNLHGFCILIKFKGFLSILSTCFCPAIASSSKLVVQGESKFIHKKILDSASATHHKIMPKNTYIDILQGWLKGTSYLLLSNGNLWR